MESMSQYCRLEVPKVWAALRREDWSLESVSNVNGGFEDAKDGKGGMERWRCGVQRGRRHLGLWRRTLW
jgi:hypothetical protein